MKREAMIADRVAASFPTGADGRALKLLSEVGVTRNSIDNAKRLISAGWEYNKAECIWNTDRGDYEVHVTFCRRRLPGIIMFNYGHETCNFVFNGFSWGYSGEGPHGLLEFSRLFGLGLESRLVFGGANLPKAGRGDLIQLFG